MKKYMRIVMLNFASNVHVRGNIFWWQKMIESIGLFIISRA